MKKTYLSFALLLTLAALTGCEFPWDTPYQYQPYEVPQEFPQIDLEPDPIDVPIDDWTGSMID
jgi:hypothetical protein